MCRAFVVCNAFGDVVDADGSLLTYPGQATTNSFPQGTAHLLRNETTLRSTLASGESTTIAVVFTNLKIDQRGASRIARMIVAAFGRALSPALTPVDGDAVMLFSTCEVDEEDIMAELTVGDLCAEAVAEAIRRAIAV
eukprot:GHVQ01014638.1.p1 GENE.GHVQ01014638.1~~GHVQ01014638.1.p1  ORF type:complete len:138 (+),score=14.36 GHVQ01014638.1:763-1176(+)